MDMNSDLAEEDMGMRRVLKRITAIHPPLDQPTRRADDSLRGEKGWGNEFAEEE